MTKNKPKRKTGRKTTLGKREGMARAGDRNKQKAKKKKKSSIGA